MAFPRDLRCLYFVSPPLHIHLNAYSRHPCESDGFEFPIQGSNSEKIYEIGDGTP